MSLEGEVLVEGQVGPLIINHLAESFSSGAGADITIVCQDATFQCHKVVLGMQSRPLHGLLLNNAEAEVLLLPDLEARTVRRLLNFLYLGVLCIGKDDIGEFLGLVEQWGISPRVTIMPTTANTTTTAAKEEGQATNMRADEGGKTRAESLSCPASPGLAKRTAEHITPAEGRTVIPVSSPSPVPQPKDGEKQLGIPNTRISKASCDKNTETSPALPAANITRTLPSLATAVSPTASSTTAPTACVERTTPVFSLRTVATASLLTQPAAGVEQAAVSELLCTTCSAACCDSVEQELHRLAHRSGCRYECRFCLQGFRVKAAWLNHLKTHQLSDTSASVGCDLPYVCRAQRCLARFSALAQLVQHRSDRHTYVAVIGSRAPSPAASDNAAYSESEDSRFYCPLTFPTVGQLGHHSVTASRHDCTEPIQTSSNGQLVQNSLISRHHDHVGPVKTGSVSQVGLCRPTVHCDRIGPVQTGPVKEERTATLIKAECDMAEEILKMEHEEEVADAKGEENLRQICNVCLAITSHLNEHSRHHQSGLPYECMYCLLPFTDFESMRVHVEQHSGRYACSACAVQLQDFEALVAHRAEHARQESAQQRRQDCSNLEQEVKRGYLSCPRAKLRFECPLCRNNLGSNRQAFTTHLALHATNSEASCRYCFTDLGSAEDLAAHITDNHRVDKHFRCPTCSFASEKLSALHLHFDTEKHPPIRPEGLAPVQAIEYENKSYGQESLCDSSPNIECRICFEEVDNLEYFYSHVKIHSGKTQYECKYCFLGFDSLVLHGHHMETEHAGESQQKYICPYCEFASRNKNHLIKHARFSDHTSGANLDLAPFRRIVKSSIAVAADADVSLPREPQQRVCPVCQLVVEGERALRSHQKLHLTGFPLECMFCLMGFPAGSERRLAAHRGIHAGGHFECLGCLEEFESYVRYVKHLEDTAHHEVYRQSFARYESIPQKVQHEEPENWSIEFAVTEPVFTPPRPQHAQRLRPLEVRLAKVLTCGACSRCLKAPCELCINCQQSKTCIFKTCSKMETISRSVQQLGSTAAEVNYPVIERRSTPPAQQRRPKRSSAPSTSPVPTTKCGVCTLMIPRSIFDLHQSIHCAAFGVDAMENIGSSKQCFYCLKILWNPGNLQRHVEAQHVFSRKPNIFTCQHCTREFADMVEFVHHLHARKHFPNKLRRKKSSSGSAPPPVLLALTTGRTATAPRSVVGQRGLTLSALTLVQNGGKTSVLYDSGEDSDNKNCLMSNIVDTDEDEERGGGGGVSDSAATAVASAAVVSNVCAQDSFTCNQCNLTFDTLTKCARHIALRHRRGTKSTQWGAVNNTAAMRRGRRLFKGRRRSLKSASIAQSPKGGNETSGNEYNSAAATANAFAYECRCCSFTTTDVDKLFAAVGHKCVATEESGNSARLLVMCAVCRVFLLDRTAVQSHRSTLHFSASSFEFELKRTCGYCKCCTRNSTTAASHNSKSTCNISTASSDVVGITSEQACILVSLFSMAYMVRVSPEEEEVRCLVCQQAVRAIQLQDHIQIHSGINLFGCKNCFKEFETREQLEEHNTACKFRKSGKFKCLLCGNIESNNEDLLVHFNSVHSSRLNWTIRTMIDSLFTKEEQTDEPAKVGEAVECADSPLNISESALRKAVDLEYCHKDNSEAAPNGLTDPAKTDSDDVDRIVNFVRDQQQRMSGGAVSLNFLNAYFSSDLEDNWFRFSLAENMRAALRSGRLLRRSKGGEDYFIVSEISQEAKAKTNREATNSCAVPTASLKEKAPVAERPKEIPVVRERRQSLPTGVVREEKARRNKIPRGQEPIRASSRHQSQGLHKQGGASKAAGSVGKRRSLRGSQVGKGSLVGVEVNEEEKQILLAKHIEDALKGLPQDHATGNCHSFEIAEEGKEVVEEQKNEKAESQLQSYERFDSDSESDIDLQQRIDTILLRGDDDYDDEISTDGLIADTAENHGEQDAEEENKEALENLMPQVKPRSVNFDDLDAIAVDLSLIMESSSTITGAPREESLVTPEVPCLGEEEHVLTNVNTMTSPVTELVCEKPASLASIVDSLTKDVYGPPPMAASGCLIDKGDHERCEKSLDQFGGKNGLSRQLVPEILQNGVFGMDQDKSLVEKLKITEDAGSFHNTPCQEQLSPKASEPGKIPVISVEAKTQNKLAENEETVVSVVEKLPVPSKPVENKFPVVSAEEKTLSKSEGLERPTRKLPIYRTALACKDALQKQQAETKSKDLKAEKQNVNRTLANTRLLGSAPKVSTLDPAKRKFQQRKKFGSVNTSFFIETVNSYELLEDTNDPYNVMEDFKEPEKKEEENPVVDTKNSPNALSCKIGKYNAIFDKVIQDGLEKMTAVFLTIKSKQSMGLGHTGTENHSGEPLSKLQTENQKAVTMEQVSGESTGNLTIRQKKLCEPLPEGEASKEKDACGIVTLSADGPGLNELKIVHGDICESLTVNSNNSVTDSAPNKVDVMRKRAQMPVEEMTSGRSKRSRHEKSRDEGYAKQVDATVREAAASKPQELRGKARGVSARALQHLEKMRARKKELAMYKVKSKTSVKCERGKLKHDESDIITKEARRGSFDEVDYLQLCMEAIQRLDEASGSSLKAIKRYILDVHKIVVKNQLISLNLESSAVAGKLTRLERGGSSFYRINRQLKGNLGGDSQEAFERTQAGTSSQTLPQLSESAEIQPSSDKKCFNSVENPAEDRDVKLLMGKTHSNAKENVQLVESRKDIDYLTQHTACAPDYSEMEDAELRELSNNSGVLTQHFASAPDSNEKEDAELKELSTDSGVLTQHSTSAPDSNEKEDAEQKESSNDPGGFTQHSTSAPDFKEKEDAEQRESNNDPGGLTQHSTSAPYSKEKEDAQFRDSSKKYEDSSLNFPSQECEITEIFSPTCPRCFKFLPNREKMRLHLQNQHSQQGEGASHPILPQDDQYKGFDQLCDSGSTGTGCKSSVLSKKISPNPPSKADNQKTDTRATEQTGGEDILVAQLAAESKHLGKMDQKSGTSSKRSGEASAQKKKAISCGERQACRSSGPVSWELSSTAVRERFPEISAVSHENVISPVSGEQVPVLEQQEDSKNGMVLKQDLYCEQKLVPLPPEPEQTSVCLSTSSENALDELLVLSELTSLERSVPVGHARARLQSEKRLKELEGTIVERERTPLEREQTPLERERTPLERERTPLERERTPLERERTPLEHERTPLERERTPLERERTPLERERTPLERELTRLERDRTPLERERTPLERERTPLEYELTPHQQTQSRERTPLSLERPTSAMSISSCLSSLDTTNPGGIKLRISFRGGNCAPHPESAFSLQGSEKGGSSQRRRRRSEDDSEEEEEGKVKKRRPRENIPQRSDMLHNITRMRFTLGDEVVCDRRLGHHQQQQATTTTERVSVSLQVEPLLDLVDIRGLHRRLPPLYLPPQAHLHYL